MLLQPELVLEGVDDRLDPLVHPAQRPEPVGLILAVGRPSGLHSRYSLKPQYQQALLRS
jgi:hypothetical protein